MFGFSQGLVSDSGTWPLSQRDWPFHSLPRLVKLERGWVCRCLLHQSDGGWPGDHVPRLDFIPQLWYQSFYSGGSEPPPFLNIEYHQQRSSHIQEPAPGLQSGPALNQDHRYLPYILHHLIIQHIHGFSSPEWAQACRVYHRCLRAARFWGRTPISSDAMGVSMWRGRFGEMCTLCWGQQDQ